MRRWEKRAGLVTRRIAGETIIVPVRGGVGDLDGIFTLNETGTLLWDRLQGIVSEDALAKAMADEYDVGLDQASGDVREFLESLVGLGLAGEV